MRTLKRPSHIVHYEAAFSLLASTATIRRKWARGPRGNPVELALRVAKDAHELAGREAVGTPGPHIALAPPLLLRSCLLHLHLLPGPS